MVEEKSRGRSGGEFTAEMRRFLPQDIAAQTLEKSEFFSYLERSVTAMLNQAKSAYTDEDGDQEREALFKM